jgi:hypothetical protein
MDLGETGLGVEWIELALDIDQWRAFVFAAMNLRVLTPRSQLVSRSLVKLAVLESDTRHTWEKTLRRP